MSDKDKEDDSSVKTGDDRSPVNQPYYRKTWGLRQLPRKSSEEIEAEKNRQKPAEGNWSLADLRRMHEEIKDKNPIYQPQNTKVPKKRNPRINYYETGRKLANILESTDKSKLPIVSWNELRPVLDHFDRVDSNILLAALCGLSADSRNILIVDYKLLERPGSKIKYTQTELSQAVAKFMVLIQSLLTYLRAKKLTSNDLFLSSSGNAPVEDSSEPEEAASDAPEEKQLIIGQPPRRIEMLFPEIGLLIFPIEPPAVQATDALNPRIPPERRSSIFSYGPAYTWAPYPATAEVMSPIPKDIILVKWISGLIKNMIQKLPANRLLLAFHPIEIDFHLLSRTIWSSGSQERLWQNLKNDRTLNVTPWRLREIIPRLNKAHQLVLYLTFELSLSCKEIGEIIGVRWEGAYGFFCGALEEIAQIIQEGKLESSLSGTQPENVILIPPNIEINPRTPPNPRNSFLPTISSDPKEQIRLDADCPLAEFRDNVLTLHPELSQAVQLNFPKKLKSNNLPPRIAGVINALSRPQIKLCFQLGVEGKKMSAVAKINNSTASVILSDVKDLIKQINSL